MGEGRRCAAMVPMWQGPYLASKERLVRGQAAEDENKEEKNRL
jgi:hypothetical protein